MYIVFIYVYTLQQVNQSQSPTYIYIIYIQCKFYIYTVCIICFLQIIHCLLHAVHIMYRNHCVKSVFMDNVSILIAYLFLYILLPTASSLQCGGLSLVCCWWSQWWRLMLDMAAHHAQIMAALRMRRILGKCWHTLHLAIHIILAYTCDCSSCTPFL